MMNRQLLFLLCMVLFVKLCYPQTVHVGDRLPVMKFDHVLPPHKDLSLEPNKYKLTILDFWAHGCVSCINSFPKLEKLQAMFGDSIQIILINYETKDSTESLFYKRNWIKKPNVKMVTQESILHKKFAVLGVPHIVWLDENLEVKYIAHSASVNVGNIRKFLRGEKLLSKPNRKTSYRSSFFDSIYEPEIQSFSYLGRNTWDLQFRGGQWGEDRAVTARNLTVVQLVQKAFSSEVFTDWNLPWKTRLEVREPDRYRKPENIENPEEWYSDHLYVYHLVVPKGRESKKYEIMKRDLANHFPLKFYVDTVLMETMVLQQTGKKQWFKSKGGNPVNTFFKRSESALGKLFEDKRRILKNQPFAYFLNGIKAMIEYDLGMPFQDDVNYKGNVDVDFDALTFDFFTLDGLEEELDRYGLKLVKEQRPVEVLVIKDLD